MSLLPSRDHFTSRPHTIVLSEVFKNQPVSDLWGTPPAIKQAVSAKLGLKLSDFDPCPYPLPEGYDSLRVSWGKAGDVVFVNPPFSQVEAFAQKSVEEMRKGNVTVLLFIASRMENAAWQKYVLPNCDKILHLRSRVKFVDLAERDLQYHGKAAFGSAIAVMSPSAIPGVWPTSEPWDWMADVKRLAISI